MSAREMTRDERAAYDLMLRFPDAATDSLTADEERDVLRLLADAIGEAIRTPAPSTANPQPTPGPARGEGERSE